MREIFPDLDRWQSENEAIALATLIGIRGSAPRRPGARLVATPSGRMSGSVSGGCVENDVYERAMQVLADGRPAVAKYGISRELAFEVGLSCGGSIEVLIEPFEDSPAWRLLRGAVEEERPAVFAAALAPDELAGNKLAAVDGVRTGTIDAALDEQILDAGHKLLDEEGGSSILELDWRGTGARVYVEAVPPPPRLFIVGATHTGIALCRLAKGLGFRVIVVDPRGAFSSPERFPDADELIQGWPDEVLDEAGLDEFSYVVTLSHDPKFDVPTLARGLRSNARYVGALGSRKTHAGRKAKLVREGFTEDELARVRAPVGLDIGARTPQEIALAVMAEMIAVRSERAGTSLVARDAPIHARD